MRLAQRHRRPRHLQVGLQQREGRDERVDVGVDRRVGPDRPEEPRKRLLVRRAGHAHLDEPPPPLDGREGCEVVGDILLALCDPLDEGAHRADVVVDHRHLAAAAVEAAAAAVGEHAVVAVGAVPLGRAARVEAHLDCLVVAREHEIVQRPRVEHEPRVAEVAVEPAERRLVAVVHEGAMRAPRGRGGVAHRPPVRAVAEVVARAVAEERQQRAERLRARLARPKEEDHRHSRRVGSAAAVEHPAPARAEGRGRDHPRPLRWHARVELRRPWRRLVVVSVDLWQSVESDHCPRGHGHSPRRSSLRWRRRQQEWRRRRQQEWRRRRRPRRSSLGARGGGGHGF